MTTPKDPKIKTPSAPANPAPTPPAEPLSPAVRIPPLFRRIDWLAFLIAFGLIWVVYVYTLAPEETLQDSGELCTGAFYAGIPHPPGYPFWSIYSWFWTKLLPIGNVAWRVEMGEATAAAFACGLVGLMVSRGSSMLMEGIEELKSMTGKWENALCLVSGAVSGILLGLGGVMWSESVAINRISLFGVPWVMIVALCLMRWIYAPNQRRYLYIAMFCLGICVTVHQTLLVMIIGIEICVAYTQPRLGRDLFLGNSIGYLLLLIGYWTHFTTFLDTSRMIVVIFHAVGLGSIVAWTWIYLDPWIKKNKSNKIWQQLLMWSTVAVVGLFVFYILILQFSKPAADASQTTLKNYALLDDHLWQYLIRPLVWLYAGLLSIYAAITVWKGLENRDFGREIPAGFLMLILWIAGASFYFYEAIAGMTNPPMEWGYPRTVEGFFHALTRGQYEKANPTDIFHDPGRFIMQLGILAGDIAHEYNWVCIFLALVPVVFFFKMRKRERAWMVALMGIYPFISVLLIILMNVAPDRQSADLFRVFYTSSHALIGILIGYGLTLTLAYMATHYQRFRSAGLMLGVAALAPGLIAFYSGVSDTFYGGVGLPSPVWRLVLFLFLAATLVFTMLSAQRFIRLRDTSTQGSPNDQLLFIIFGTGALFSGIASVLLVYFRPASLDREEPSLKLSELSDGLHRIFAPHQYNIPVLGGMLVLVIVLLFIAALFVYRKRAPLAVTLGIFALMPISSALSHWGFCEQRNHWFGYWFGHDMFTPPVEGPDGKLTYDAKVREQMMKGPKGNLVYPEMAKDTILYGGTDPGRFNPTYMIFCDSFLSSNCLPSADTAFDRRDVYLITQNALADPTYLDYLRAQYFRSQQKDPPFFSELARYVLKDKDYKTNLLAKAVSPLDWYFEARGARVEKRWRTFTSWFSEKEFTNLKSLADQLRAKSDPLSQWLFQNLSSETQDLISKSDESRIGSALSRDLNVLLDRELKQQEELDKKKKERDAITQKIFGGDDSQATRAKRDAIDKEVGDFKIDRLYDTNRFAGVTISDYLQRFIAQNPQGDTRIRLNRLLLEAAYPADIVKSLGGVYPDREIYIPNAEDSQNAFSDYMVDVQQRLYHDQTHPEEAHQVKPGEEVHQDPSGHVQVSGQVAVMAINGLLTKTIFDHNPDNEFYVEESFPLDWMFPHLTPYGVIMKINRQPLPELTQDICDRDHEFWAKYSERLIGNWITYDTPVTNITDFAERVYLRHDYTGFKGDERFVRDEQAQKAFSKLRSSIAGIYSYRLGQPPSGGVMPQQYIAQGPNRAIVEKEADFAFKQALAFCPYSPEAVYRYVQLLVSMRRVDDAIVVAKTANKLDPYNPQFSYLVDNLNNIKNQPNVAAQIQSQITQLESEIKSNPTNFLQQFELVQKYLQLNQPDQAFQTLDDVLKNPKVSVQAVMTVADAYNRLNQPVKLQAALEKMTQIEPDSPEAWYDLAASQARLNQNPAAIESLKTALNLNAKRLAQNPKTNDIRGTLATDQRFAALREVPEFKALTAPK